MPTIHKCDLAIVGGGLAGGLIALAVHAAHPDMEIRLIEADDHFGGNHFWSFFGGDVDEGARALLEPIVAHAWSSYDVRFPAHERTLPQAYFTIRSELLDARLRAVLPRRMLLTERKVLACSPTAVILSDGDRVTATGVIDARGAGDLSQLACGWQKFVGCEVRIAGGHGVERPVVMDATVAQEDGYRFVYCLPFTPDTILIEDTYYSDSPVLDAALVEQRVSAYEQAHGWHATEVLRRESGVLPVVMGGDFEGYWKSGGNNVAKAGARAGLFHPTTGYSVPDAARLAIRIAAGRDFSGPALHRLTHDHARAAWGARKFYRMLDLMLFKAAEPDARYRVLERFYRLSPGLVARFYAARSTGLDKARVLVGKPPVPIGRAIAALRHAS